MSVVCEALRISRAGFYAWRSEEESARAQRDRELLPLVRDVFWRHKRRYGARRIAVELGRSGRAVRRRSRRQTPENPGSRGHSAQVVRPQDDAQSALAWATAPIFSSMLRPPTRINEVWVADITYIPLRTGDFAYLALVMDLFSRRVLGWDLAALMTETLVLEALRQAIGLRQPPPNLIHHSDRGGQYAGDAYRAVLRRAAMRQSMSRADECYDNAFMESCFGTIKTELEMTEYDHVPHARAEIGPLPDLLQPRTPTQLPRIPQPHPIRSPKRRPKLASSTVRKLPSTSCRFKPFGKWAVEIHKYDYGVDAQPYCFMDKIDRSVENQRTMILTLPVVNRIVEQVKRRGWTVTERTVNSVSAEDGMGIGATEVSLTPDYLEFYANTVDDLEFIDTAVFILDELGIGEQVKHELQSVIGSPDYMRAAVEKSAEWKWWFGPIAVSYSHFGNSDKLWAEYHQP